MSTEPRSNVIIRHRKERLSKCSLRGLEARADLAFYRYPDRMPEPEAIAGCVTLSLDPGAPLLGPADRERPLLLLDGTWRLAPKLAAAVAQLQARLPAEQRPVARGLPPALVTAYPRAQGPETACPDPARGLASVEALFAAYVLTGRDPAGLLDGYRWREALLEANPLLREQRA